MLHRVASEAVNAATTKAAALLPQPPRPLSTQQQRSTKRFAPAAAISRRGTAVPTLGVIDDDDTEIEEQQHEHQCDDENNAMQPTPVEEDALAALFASCPRDIDKFVCLRNLQTTNPTEFYALLAKHTEAILPFIYTPTVGEACQTYAHLPIETVGLYITAEDDAQTMAKKLRAWTPPDGAVAASGVQVIVVTDGERILGLGDLGAGGMGISEGKILLYTAAAGVDPRACMPVCLDVGTNNDSLLSDPKYAGLRQRRLTGASYFAFVETFIAEVKRWRPHVLLQFEDFGNHTAFALLETYRPKLCCFNDDIQGTAAITLAGVLAGLRLTKGRLRDQTVLFQGAGEAGVGCGNLIARAMQAWGGMTEDEAKKRILFMDSKGLVCKARGLDTLQAHKRAYAHDLPPARTLLEAVRAHKPTVLIGVSTVRGAFSEDVVRAMAEQVDRPIIFPLSNPTSKAECTFEEAFGWTEGRAIFASGSPFAPIHRGGGDGSLVGTFHPAQANNAYIFPAIGHAAVLCGCREITEDVFLEAAKALATISPVEDLDRGRLFPRFSKIRSVSARIMAAVAEHMCREGLGTKPEHVTTWAEYAAQQSKL